MSILYLFLIIFIQETEHNPYAMAGHSIYWDSAASTNAKWLRMWAGEGGALWGEIQPASLDSFKWDKQDRWIRSADSAGFNIMLTIRTGGDSTFGSTYHCNWVDTSYESELGPQGNFPSASFPPMNYTDWYNFVYAVVSRYNGTTPDPEDSGSFLPEVRYYETQAEPDWGYWYGTREEYFDQFVPTFCNAVRAANPNAVIIGPSLTGYGIAWAHIKEMNDSGVNQQDIVDFYNKHLQYQALWPVGWNYIQQQLNNDTVQRVINFVNYSYIDSTFYDKRGFHSYENWETDPLLIDYEQRMMKANGYTRPAWWTEMGHIDKRAYTSIPEPEDAARTFKKIILAHSSGVEWMCYSPMYNINLPFLNIFIPLYDLPNIFNPDSIIPRQSKTSFAFLAGKINEETGFKFSSAETLSNSDLFWFTSDTLLDYHLLSAWADSGVTETVWVNVPIGTTTIISYDYLGAPTSLSFSDSVGLALTWQPILVEFYHPPAVAEQYNSQFFSLKVYPTVFAQNITIDYQLPIKEKISIRIYDIMGRVVTTLINDISPSGSHSVSWEAKNLSNGVYFCRLESKQRIQTKKLLLLRL